MLIGHGSAHYRELLTASNQRPLSIDSYKITDTTRFDWSIEFRDLLFYCIGKQPVLKYGSTTRAEAKLPNLSLVSYPGLSAE